MKKSKSIILFTTRPITSKYTKSLIEQMCILKEYQDNGYKIILWTPKKSKKTAEYIEQVSGITIDEMICYIDDYKRCMTSPKPIYDTWHEFLKKEDWVSQFKNVTDIVMFGGILSDASGLTREKNKIGPMMNTRAQMNFAQNGSYLVAIYQLVKMSRDNKIPIHEICFDPCENSISQLTDYYPHELHCYHGYDWDEYKLKRLDSLQAYLNSSPNGLGQFFEDVKKDCDITFGFTALTKHREQQYDDVMEGLNANKNLNVKLFVRHKRLEIDTFINRDDYLDAISKSRYTLLIPPYDLKHFSIYRFVESINNDCLPLITSDVYIDDFVKSFGIDLEIINKLIVEYSTIGNKVNEFSESERVELLEYFKSKCLNYERKLNI